MCRYGDLQPERGVAALIGGEQVALFRTFDGTLHAIGNQDPFTGAFVLSRGIVGSRGEHPDGRVPAAQAGLRSAHRGLPGRRDGRRAASIDVRVRDGLVEVMAG